MAVSPAPLEQVLARLSREGDCCERLPQGRVRCWACGHRCLILPGQRGVCKVRWNEAGRLMVPAGYVAALQCDPVEKKPFFHAYPGARALSFGMLGCDYHCSYCCSPRTLVATSNGPIQIVRLWEQAGPSPAGDPSERVLPGLEVYSHTGRARPVRALFRHAYDGPMVTLTPAYLLPLRVTPDHELLALTEEDLEAGRPPGFVRAVDMTTSHYLAVPKQFEFSRPAVLDLAAMLQPLTRQIRYRRKIGAGLIRRVLRLSARGLSSREIGRRLMMDPSHIRHLRSKVARGVWDPQRLSVYPAGVHVEDGRVRLTKEHAPGIPERIDLDERLAALIGYYAAEGCVVHGAGRVHSVDLAFTLGLHERPLAERIRHLVREVFGVEATCVRRPTTLAVVVQKASVALFFEALCGIGARQKHLPTELFHAPRPVVEAFLGAYVEGDGHRYRGGRTLVSTVSRRLAIEVLWLVLKSGRLPALCRTPQRRDRRILGRIVRNAPVLYTVHWFEDASRRRWLRQDARHHYVPVRAIRRRRYRGFVYNLEVDDDHSYLAQFIATHNCQNWLTSQALRDQVAGVPPQAVTPGDIVQLARRHRARILTSTYNEPLITSEWAGEVFRAGRAHGLLGAYVSNGNATPEVLDYIRPWVDLYKVDLKGFDDRRYRRLGGLLQTVLDTIRAVHARGFWLEVVTLVIPGFNDSDAELGDLARFLVSVSPDIPWHVTAFHPDYRMTDRDATGVRTLLRAAEIGRRAGLRFVYAGNAPGQVGAWENTCCPGCGMLLVERLGYTILTDRLTPSGGTCPGCGQTIPGLWQ